MRWQVRTILRQLCPLIRLPGYRFHLGFPRSFGESAGDEFKWVDLCHSNRIPFLAPRKQSMDGSSLARSLSSQQINAEIS